MSFFDYVKAVLWLSITLSCAAAVSVAGYVCWRVWRDCRGTIADMREYRESGE